MFMLQDGMTNKAIKITGIEKSVMREKILKFVKNISCIAVGICSFKLNHKL